MKNTEAPLDYYYDYDEMKVVLEGEFRLENVDTGQVEIARAKDAILFTVDQSLFQASLRAAKAEVDRAEAAAAMAKREHDRVNELLAARAMGLGASLITLPLWNQRAVRRTLGLPHAVTPCCIVPLGWPSGRYGPTTRRPVGEVVHLDHYGNRPFLDTEFPSVARPPTS